MKKFFYLAFLLTLSFNLLAQEMIKEIELKGPGKITLNTGQEISGIIDYSFVESRKVRCKVGENKPEGYVLADVKNFTINDTLYTVIEQAKLQYVGRLMSNENLKIRKHLLINQARTGTPQDGVLYYNTSEQVFLEFVEANAFFQENSMALNSKKLASLTSNYPELSSKIKNKEAGYQVKGLMLDNIKIELINKIIDEYNAHFE